MSTEQLADLLCGLICTASVMFLYFKYWKKWKKED